MAIHGAGADAIAKLAELAMGDVFQSQARAVRTAGNTRIRQVGTASPELQLVELEAETVRGDLCQRSPGALALVLSTKLDEAGAVTPQRMREPTLPSATDRNRS